MIFLIAGATNHLAIQIHSFIVKEEEILFSSLRVTTKQQLEKDISVKRNLAHTE